MQITELSLEMQQQLQIIGDGSLATLEEAMDQFESEHDLVKELYADFDRSRKINALMFKLLRMADDLIKRMNQDGGMFLRQPTRDKLQEFSELLEIAKSDIPKLQEPLF